MIVVTKDGRVAHLCGFCKGGVNTTYTYDPAWCPRFAPRFWALTWASLYLGACQV